MSTAFRIVADCIRQMAACPSRMGLCGLVATLLHAVEADDIATVAHLLLGQVTPMSHQLKPRDAAFTVRSALAPLFAAAHMSWPDAGADAEQLTSAVSRALAHRPALPADGTASLTIADVTGGLAFILDDASQCERITALRELCRSAGPHEVALMIRLLFGLPPAHLRTDIVLDGIALAAGADPELVKRSFMVMGDVGVVAYLALTTGVSALERNEVMIFTPVYPMLAQHADDVADAWLRLGGRMALEYRLNGARIQVHKSYDEVRIYTRHLMEITAAMPEIIELVQARIDARSAILEGELVALNGGNGSLPVQELMRRFQHTGDVGQVLRQAPSCLYAFDLLYLNGEPLIDRPNAERWSRLRDVVQENHQLQLAPRLAPLAVEDGVDFCRQAIDDGHDGVIAKRLDGVYLPGTRSAAWLTVQEPVTLTLAITGAEWGSGRCAGWLSNYHLSAYDVLTGEMVLVGKVSKGLRQQEFDMMLDVLARRRHNLHMHTVPVSPPVMVQIAFTDIQRNPAYPAGLSLRFARLLRFLPDCVADDIDSVQKIRYLYTQQQEAITMKAA